MKLLFTNLFLLFSFFTVHAQTSDMARGADISWCTEMEADGRKFYNEEGVETDIFALMKEIGMTAIRLRVWVDPSGLGYGAWSDKADVLAKARRAHQQGLDLMIDFHYSDFFTDPGTQTMSSKWAGLTTTQLKDSLAAHTKDVLQALKKEGIEPKWVQVGNETNNGMIWDAGKIDWNKSGSARYTNYVALSNVAYDAVKAVLPSAYVIVHLGSTDMAVWFFNEFKNAGGKFDMIGLSHYPTEAEWNSEVSTSKFSNVNAAKFVQTAATTHNVPVMICETGFDVSKPALASQVMKDLFTRMKSIPQCAGIFYWEPQVDGQWKPAYYNKKGWSAYGNGAFTSNGRPTAALKAFSGKDDDDSSNYPKTLSVYNESGNTILTTLSSTSEGVYTGQLNATKAWLNFHVVDESNNIWYGTDPNDKTTVSSADGHWKFWIDSEQTGVYDITIDLVNMKWTHSYNADATAGIYSHLDDSRTPLVWFDLYGNVVSTPSDGKIYIVRKGKKMQKVIY